MRKTTTRAVSSELSYRAPRPLPPPPSPGRKISRFDSFRDGPRKRSPGVAPSREGSRPRRRKLFPQLVARAPAETFRAKLENCPCPCTTVVFPKRSSSRSEASKQLSQLVAVLSDTDLRTWWWREREREGDEVSHWLVKRLVLPFPRSPSLLSTVHLPIHPPFLLSSSSTSYRRFYRPPFSTFSVNTDVVP